MTSEQIETIRVPLQRSQLESSHPGIRLSLRDEPVLTREFIYNTVAIVFEVDGALLAQPSRGRARIALARQMAMYLAHVACGLSLSAVGRVFERDRSTVAHACKRVEDRREDADFDAAVAMMEGSVRTIVRTSEALRRDLELAERGGV